MYRLCASETFQVLHPIYKLGRIDTVLQVSGDHCAPGEVLHLTGASSPGYDDHIVSDFVRMGILCNHV